MLNQLFRTELKGVVKLAVAEAGGQENCVNVSSRIDRHAAFSDYSNPALAGRHMPIDVAVEIDAFNNNGRIVAAMARMVGYIAVPAPTVLTADADITALCKIATESAEAVAAFSTARADGVITPQEAREVRKQLHDALTAFLELDQRLQLIERDMPERDE